MIIKDTRRRSSGFSLPYTRCQVTYNATSAVKSWLLHPKKAANHLRRLLGWLLSQGEKWSLTLDK
jgi:hypothetical protein